MKLEFKKGYITESLFDELGFSQFLRNFHFDIPILSHKILSPLSATDGIKHFQNLKSIEQRLTSQKISLDHILSVTKQLPTLNQVFPYFKSKNLEQYHFFLLYQFISSTHSLEQHEKKDRNKFLDEFLAALSPFFNSDFSQIKYSKDFIEIEKKISRLDQSLEYEVKEYEKNIYNEIKLSMIYPYPKEVNFQQDLYERLSLSSLVTCKHEHDLLYIGYNIPQNIKSLIRDKKKLQDHFSELMEKILKRINNTATPFLERLEELYNNRVKITYDYILLKVKSKYNLIIPTFTNNTEQNFNKVHLPILKQQKGDKYTPLSIELNKGSNILFGANMSGKTTVFKTLFFNLTLIKMGLPIPAKEVKIVFPNNIFFHLRNSGSISNNLSGFSDELTFLSNNFSESDYIFVDEMLQSTDPLNGTILSKEILQYFNNKNFYFFCSSQYPQILDLEDISLFKMKDIEIKNKNNINLTSLIESIPHEVIKVSSKDKEIQKEDYLNDTNPLQISLCFPFEEKLKEKINKQLDIKRK